MSSKKRVRDTGFSKTSTGPAPKKARQPDRYLYIMSVKEGDTTTVAHFVLSFADAAQGKRLHALIEQLVGDNLEETVYSILHNLILPVAERDWAEDELDEEDDALVNSLVDCVEAVMSVDEHVPFGTIKNGLCFEVVF